MKEEREGWKQKIFPKKQLQRLSDALFNPKLAPATANNAEFPQSGHSDRDHN